MPNEDIDDLGEIDAELGVVVAGIATEPNNEIENEEVAEEVVVEEVGTGIDAVVGFGAWIDVAVALVDVEMELDKEQDFDNVEMVVEALVVLVEEQIDEHQKLDGLDHRSSNVLDQV